MSNEQGDIAKSVSLLQDNASRASDMEGFPWHGGYVGNSRSIETAPGKEALNTHKNKILPDAYHALEDYRGFRFRYCWDPVWKNKIRVYVERHAAPDYDGRDASAHLIHMWPQNGNAPPYICFKEQFAPTSLDGEMGARAFAQKWADLTLIYASTGRTISEQIASAA